MNIKLLISYGGWILFFSTMLKSVTALTMDDMAPSNLINKVAQMGNPNPSPLPVPNQQPPVGQYEEYRAIEPCAVPPPQQVARRAPTSQRVERVARQAGTRTYWAGSERVLRDKRAISLLNMAPGTKRSSISDRFGMGTWNGDAYVYETGDGLIQLNFSASSRLSTDELTWAGFVQ